MLQNNIKQLRTQLSITQRELAFMVGTSIASIVSRKILRDARFPFGWRPLAPVGKFRSLKMVSSNKIATFVGRYVPYVGYMMALVIAQQIARKTRTQYNLIARSKDRIQWTYF